MSSSARAAPDRRSATVPKRSSLLPKPSSIAIDPTVLIAQHAQLTGTYPITIGPNSVLHPHSKINSSFAPVLVGEGVILHEKSKIGMGSEYDSTVDSRRSSFAPTSVRDSLRAEGTVLGKNVVVESNAVVEAAEVGEGTVVEVGAVLGRGCVVGKVRISYATCEGELTYRSSVQSHHTPPSRQIRIFPTTRSSIAAPSNALTKHCSYDLRL
jgi:dynactin-6